MTAKLTRKAQVLEVLRAGGRTERPDGRLFRLFDAAGREVEAWQTAIASALVEHNAPAAEQRSAVVGFACGDGGCQPLTSEMAAALFERVETRRADRERAMPTEQDAIRLMFEAWQRLKELGWREAVYCPKDGSTFDAIEPGSTGIHTCHYQGNWPTGGWWLHDAEDLYPSRPMLWRTTRAAEVPNA